MQVARDWKPRQRSYPLLSPVESAAAAMNAQQPCTDIQAEAFGKQRYSVVWRNARSSVSDESLKQERADSVSKCQERLLRINLRRKKLAMASVASPMLALTIVADSGMTRCNASRRLATQVDVGFKASPWTRRRSVG